MRKLKVYLDTSVVSYLYQLDTPEKMKDTLELWELFRQGRYEVYISDIVLNEISDILFAIYRHASKAEFIEADIMAMRELLRLVQGRVDSQNHDMDKIQVKQLQWLCGNLNTFISQMS